jgi:hypothetical protein
VIERKPGRIGDARTAARRRLMVAGALSSLLEVNPIVEDVLQVGEREHTLGSLRARLRIEHVT